MKKLAIASAILSVSALVNIAHAYQSEIGVNAGIVDPDNGSSKGTYGVEGTVYFEPVQTRNSPLAEAAFLDRASNLKGQYNYSKVDDIKLHNYGVGVEYYIPNSDFYLGGDIGRQNMKFKNFSDFNTTTYSAEVGYLPAPGLLVAAGVKGYNNDDRNRSAPSLRAKYVTALPSGNDINLEADATFGDIKDYNLAADYYLDKTLSLGADYQKQDSLDSKEWGINARKFFTQDISLEGRVGFGKVNDNDYNSYGLAAKYRF